MNLRDLEGCFTPIDIKARMDQREREAWDANEYRTHAFLDVDEKHPALFGDAILLRDDDGMGFALQLERWRGQFVEITIRRVPTTQTCLWMRAPASRDV